MILKKFSLNMQGDTIFEMKSTFQVPATVSTFKGALVLEQSSFPTSQESVSQQLLFLTSIDCIEPFLGIVEENLQIIQSQYTDNIEDMFSIKLFNLSMDFIQTTKSVIRL